MKFTFSRYYRYQEKFHIYGRSYLYITLLVNSVPTCWICKFSLVPSQKIGDIKEIEKIQKRHTKLVIKLKNKPCTYRHLFKTCWLYNAGIYVVILLKSLKLPINNIYDTAHISSDLSFNKRANTRGNNYRLYNCSFYCDLQKHFSLHALLISGIACLFVVNYWSLLMTQNYTSPSAAACRATLQACTLFPADHTAAALPFGVQSAESCFSGQMVERRPVVFIVACWLLCRWSIINWFSCPAHVVQWSNHLGAMCSRAWRSQWPRIDSSLGPGASAY